ncbi:MAG: hypothetical protein IPJ88_16290 [Myxococcales bacterium]|nr:MAG: hypothetical protein IPJ88_16290 [Myxococcales bacterium]
MERAGNLFKIVVGLGIIGALGLGVAGYVMTRESADSDQSDPDLAGLYERGEIQLEGQAGILNAPRGKRGRSAKNKSGGSGDLSYEDAMNQAVDLGDVSGGNDIATLSSEQIASVMNRSMRSLSNCVGAELRSASRPGAVRIDLAIEGSGRVLGASVHAGSASFKSCVVAQVRKVKFPSFSSPRMGATFTFRVD